MKDWIHPDDITPEPLFLQRRQIIRSALLLGVLPAVQALGADAETSNTFEQISRYNNYYEFSTNKEVIWKLAEDFHPLPWTLSIEGEVQHPRVIGFEDLIRQFPEEERIYRLRCVEGWAMVIPWRGFPLANLLKSCNPTSRAKYVEFIGLERPSEMIGQRSTTMAWPYTEGLRIDEAMHPLTLMVTGLYGHPLPSQNGAPLRLAVPWKYGFKSIKAITKIRLVERQPITSWMRSAPNEYGFYANVNPDVPHPRWSQRREVKIGNTSKQATLPFNGYADQVASLYRGMDLVKNF